MRAAIPEVSKFETGIGARSLILSTGMTMTTATPPTLCWATATSTTKNKVTTIRVMTMATSTYTRPLNKKWHRAPLE